MSSIFGICRPGGAPVETSEITAMSSALARWRPDRQGIWTEPGAGIGHLLLATTAHPEREAQPFHDRERDVALTADARLDNREDLAKELNVDSRALEQMPDSRLVLRAYLEWGDACVDHLRGDFAFAVWDAPHRRLFAARDPFGVKPFYYTVTGHSLAFATEIRGLLALPFVDRAVNDTWIGDFLHRLSLDSAATFYRSIRRLEPGHALTFNADGPRLRRYFTLAPARGVAYARDGDYVEAFRESLTRAVARRIDTTLACGAELSGGLDSSAIAVIAHRLVRARGGELATYSQVRPASFEPGLRIAEDARAAIDVLRDREGMTRMRFFTGEGRGTVDLLEWWRTWCDQPARSVVSLYNEEVYESAAADGVRVLLSGFGGNQGVSARADLRRGELLNTGAWRELWEDLARDPQAGSPAAAVARLIARAYAPARPLWGAVTRRGPLWQKFPLRATRGEFRRRTGMWRRTLGQSRGARARTMLEEIQWLLTEPSVAERLEAAHVSASARRLEYRYPLLDAELISLYLATPARLRNRHGAGRYLFRLAGEEWLPREILDEENRASAFAGSALRKQRDREELRRRLAAIPEQSRVWDYVDPAKLREAPMIRGAARHAWNRETEVLGVLMLSEALDAALG